MRLRFAAALGLCLFGTPAWAHRLDRPLHATLISLERDRILAQVRVVPGASRARLVLSAIDTDGDGKLSPAEERVYAERLLREAAWTVDGSPITPSLVTVDVNAPELMLEGVGQITIVVEMKLPAGAPRRILTVANHHEQPRAVYLVNCLVPQDARLHVVSQRRNADQSFYELTWLQPDDLP